MDESVYQAFRGSFRFAHVLILLALQGFSLDVVKQVSLALIMRCTRNCTALGVRQEPVQLVHKQLQDGWTAFLVNDALRDSFVVDVCFAVTNPPDRSPFIENREPPERSQGEDRELSI